MACMGEGRQAAFLSTTSKALQDHAAEIWQQNGKWYGESKEIVKMGVQAFTLDDALKTPKPIIQALVTFHSTLPYFADPIYATHQCLELDQWL